MHLTYPEDKTKQDGDRPLLTEDDITPEMMGRYTVDVPDRQA